jgi:CO/xanthine dehydrogenase Mo-binding subunit
LEPHVEPMHHVLGAPVPLALGMWPLAHNDVRQVGDPVAMVVATDRYIAEDAADAVVVTYREQIPVIGASAALAKEARPVPRRLGPMSHRTLTQRIRASGMRSAFRRK